MKVAGIVCEYNPMHNGHVYQIAQTKKSGATHIVCVMSGNFVQRGDCAYADKWIRSDIAIHCGADLVVDLPSAWSCDSAQNFAFGAVSILDSLGIDVLSFGSETDDIKLLKKCSQIDDEKLSQYISPAIKNGASYPSALYDAVLKVCGEDAAKIVSSPNSTLALEYIKALSKLSSNAQPLAIKRKTAKHDDTSFDDYIVSAAALRGLDDFSKMKEYVPTYAYDKLSESIEIGFAPARLEYAERAVLSYLRTVSREKISECISDERGLCDRIFKFSKTAESLDELFSAVKTKNVTMAKVRRSILRLYLGINSDISVEKPPYIKVLAANKKGLEIIKNAKGNIPIVSKHSDFSKLSSFAKEVYMQECRATDLYALFSKKIRACCLEQTSPVNIFR